MQRQQLHYRLGKVLRLHNVARQPRRKGFPQPLKQNGPRPCCNRNEGQNLPSGALDMIQFIKRFFSPLGNIYAYWFDKPDDWEGDDSGHPTRLRNRDADEWEDR